MTARWCTCRPARVVEQPIELLFVTTPPDGGAPVMTHPRVLIVAGENAQVRVVESYGGGGESPYLTNAVTEVVAGPAAVVDHYKLVRESPSGYHIGAMHVRLGRAANFSSHAVTLGGAIVRNDAQALLDGEGAECTLNGLYLANGRRLVDNHTTIHHARPHCSSHELYKGILDGEARAVFNGKIIVAIDAQKTDAKQTNKALPALRGRADQHEARAGDLRRRRQVHARGHGGASSTRTRSSTCAPAGWGWSRRGASSSTPSPATC